MESVIFEKNWLCVGSTLQIREPGAYFTGHVGRFPFIVIRDSEGQVQAFLNVCRHRAMRLLPSECGRVNRIQCGYHGWEYLLDGRLAKSTRMKDIKDFSPKDFGLFRIKVQVWGPLIFLLFGEATSRGGSSPGMLGELKDLLDGRKFSEGLEHVTRRSYTLNCNWKVVSSNYLDGGYHVPVAHKDLASNLDPASYRTTLHKGFSLQTCDGAKEGASERVGGSAIYAYVYPNMMINRYGPWLDVNVVFPLAPDKCVVVFDYFLESDFVRKKKAEREGAFDEFVKSSLEASDKVQQEDIFLCENVQKGLQSGWYDVGRYAPRVEHADHDFHVWLARELRAELREDQ